MKKKDYCTRHVLACYKDEMLPKFVSLITVDYKSLL